MSAPSSIVKAGRFLSQVGQAIVLPYLIASMVRAADSRARRE